MIKKLFASCSIMLSIALLVSVVAFASPSVVYPNEEGNSNSLIHLKRPSVPSVTTSERNYTIMAAGRQGVEVTVYSASAYDGNFYRVFQNGHMLEDTIGASGVYVVSIELLDGGNKILINAENENERQIIKIDITRMTPSQVARINNLSIGDLFNAYR